MKTKRLKFAIAIGQKPGGPERLAWQIDGSCSGSIANALHHVRGCIPRAWSVKVFTAEIDVPMEFEEIEHLGLADLAPTPDLAELVKAAGALCDSAEDAMPLVGEKAEQGHLDSDLKKCSEIVAAFQARELAAEKGTK